MASVKAEGGLGDAVGDVTPPCLLRAKGGSELMRRNTWGGWGMEPAPSAGPPGPTTGDPATPLSL